MGRHRRVTEAPVHDGAGGLGRHRGARPKRAVVPVRTGLLGASAAMAVGVVTVASGLIPGLGSGFDLAPGQGSGPVRADGSGERVTPSEVSPVPTGRGSEEASRQQDRTRLPGPSSSAGKPSEPSGGDASRKPPAPRKPGASQGGNGKGDGGQRDGARDTGDGRDKSGRRTGNGDGSGAAAGGERAAENKVLTLVNQERAEAGCPRVRPDSGLRDLAEDFSEDMAVRGFFAHVSPDGDSPWQRADRAGISDLGGENIARGQADAQSVMESWMGSPGHKANILNCEYRTMGVGAHFGAGGPWWTQEFGF